MKSARWTPLRALVALQMRQSLCTFSRTGRCSCKPTRLTMPHMKCRRLNSPTTRIPSLSSCLFPTMELVSPLQVGEFCDSYLHFSTTANVTRPKDYTNGFGQEYTCRSGLLLNDTLSQWNYTMMAWLDDFKFEAFRGNSTTTQFNANGR